MEATPGHFSRLSTQQLLHILYLVWFELTNRFAHQHSSGGTATYSTHSDSAVPPPAPAPASPGTWLDPPPASVHHRPRNPRGSCGQSCKYCRSACSRATADHIHHSCWAHRNCRD